MAGITFLKEFQKPALRGLVDAMRDDRLETPTFADKYMPNENIYSNTFAYDVIKKSNNIAAMIGVGSEPPVVDRDAVASRMGELAKYGLKYIATEEELLQLNQPRNNAEQGALIDKLLVKGADLVKALEDRIQISKVQAIAQGGIDYNKNGVKVKIDFTQDMPEENKVALTGDTWANADHDVIGDLMSWVEDYEKNAGVRPTEILLSREIQALLLKNSVVVTEAVGSDKSGRGRVSVDELNGVLAGYDLPKVTVVSKRKAVVKDIYTGEDETIEYFPKNRIVMISEGVGSFLFGPTAENDFQPGMVLDAYDKQEPIESIMRVAAAGFPVVEQPNLLFHADVLED